MQTTTLQEFGPQLPVLPKSIADRAFSFRTWTMKEERDVAKLRRENKKTGVFVRKVFDLMLAELGGADWQSLDVKQRSLILNQMPYGNILYMYIWLRYEAMGPDFAIQNLQCPMCEAKIEQFVANLETLEVEVREPDDSAEGLYMLAKPFKQGDCMVHGLYMRDTPWDVMERVTTAEALNGDVKISFLNASCAAAKTDVQERAELSPVMLVQALPKREIEGAFRFVEDHNAGPVMSVELKCPECSSDFRRPLNWNYDHFFGSSSLPRARSKGGKSSSTSSTTSPA